MAEWDEDFGVYCFHVISSHLPFPYVFHVMLQIKFHIFILFYSFWDLLFLKYIHKRPLKSVSLEKPPWFIIVIGPQIIADTDPQESLTLILKLNRLCSYINKVHKRRKMYYWYVPTWQRHNNAIIIKFTLNLEFKGMCVHYQLQSWDKIWLKCTSALYFSLHLILQTFVLFAYSCIDIYPPTWLYICTFADGGILSRKISFNWWLNACFFVPLQLLNQRIHLSQWN